MRHRLEWFIHSRYGLKASVREISTPSSLPRGGGGTLYLQWLFRCKRQRQRRQSRLVAMLRSRHWWCAVDSSCVGRPTRSSSFPTLSATRSTSEAGSTTTPATAVHTQWVLCRRCMLITNDVNKDLSHRGQEQGLECQEPGPGHGCQLKGQGLLRQTNSLSEKKLHTFRPYKNNWKQVITDFSIISSWKTHNDVG